MADISWIINRLRAMEAKEIVWRVSQKKLQAAEKKRFRKKTSVTSALFYPRLNGLRLSADRMKLNHNNKEYSLNTRIRLLGGYDYSVFKKQWDAGFQTGNHWPDEFSYSLEYKNRDDIGDARTNWELNRHFQFAMLAKDYAASGDPEYLQEFRELFDDWDLKNPFLWGISWTSPMEVAIRVSNWCYAYCFLGRSGKVPSELLLRLERGILNMTAYVTRHYSQYSSANNHLIVEAYAIGQTGILCDYQPWIELAVDILTKQLPLQNYSDGVNKELALHYQSFYMEAMGLMMRLLLKNGLGVPDSWEPMLKKMCAYVADCMGDYGETIVFGDDDEGKILDLQGGIQNHYQYTLGMFSIMLDRQYTDLEESECENLNWLFTENERRAARTKPSYHPPLCACYKEGGNTILRSKDRQILIGIDHAALGLGSIAAHGHADALSFQMFVKGIPVFVDPGTYIYHCDLKSRNAYRKTENHNTVSVGEKDQSEMLGAFLWGRRAKCDLLEHKEEGGHVYIKARHDGYKPCIHTREFDFDGEQHLHITETFTDREEKQIHFIFSPDFRLAINECDASFETKEISGEMRFDCDDRMILVKGETGYSRYYGVQRTAPALLLETNGQQIQIDIRIVLKTGGLE